MMIDSGLLFWPPCIGYACYSAIRLLRTECSASRLF